MYMCVHCGETTYYNWVICPSCNWSPEIKSEINVEVTMNLQYEICPLCGGYRWKWKPFDTDYNDTSGSSDIKPCGCPPEVGKKVKVEEEKEKQPQIIVCPNCNQELCVFLEERD